MGAGRAVRFPQGRPAAAFFQYAVLAILALLLLQGCYQSEKAPPYHWYSVRADFEVGGETVSLGGVVECESQSPLTSGFFSSGGRVKYHHSTYLFAKRLADGSALVITPKSACTTPEVSISVDFPDDYRPAVFWLDDAEKPTRMEFFFSDAYFRRPDARVRFKGFFAERIKDPKGSPPVYWHRRNEREVPWLETEDPPAFRGYHVTVAEESQWREIQGLAAYLDPLADITALPWDFPAFEDESRRRRVDELLSSGVHGPYNGVGPSHACRAADGATRPRCEGIARTFGMAAFIDRRGARYTATDRSVGSVVLVPNYEAIPTGQVQDISIEGALVSAQIGTGMTFYDPRSQELYRVEEESLVNRRTKLKFFPGARVE